MTTRCRLPPDRSAARAVQGGAGETAAAQKLSPCRRPGRGQSKPRPVAVAAPAAERQVLPHRHAGHGRHGQGIVRDDGDAALAHARDRPARGVLVPQPAVAARSGGRRPRRGRASSRWPLPETPATPRISPARRRSADRADRRRRRRGAVVTPSAPARGAGAKRSPDVGSDGMRIAEHQATAAPLRWRRAGPKRTGHPALAQHRDAVGAGAAPPAACG